MSKQHEINISSTRVDISESEPEPGSTNDLNTINEEHDINPRPLNLPCTDLLHGKSTINMDFLTTQLLFLLYVTFITNM